MQGAALNMTQSSAVVDMLSYSAVLGLFNSAALISYVWNEIK
jgi:hypothetical protein